MRLQKQEMIACYEQEKEKLQSTQSGLYQLLSDIGLENVNQGMIAIKLLHAGLALGIYKSNYISFRLQRILEAFEM